MSTEYSTNNFDNPPVGIRFFPAVAQLRIARVTSPRALCEPGELAGNWDQRSLVMQPYSLGTV
jgi:hypothetical protein